MGETRLPPRLLAYGKWRFIKIAFPGSINTFARGINDSGAITGAYSDSANQWHGFVRDPSGAYTSFDAPDASSQSLGTTPTAINASGEIAGYYEDSSCVFHGFVRDPSGNLTEFDTPGGTVLTILGPPSTLTVV